MELDQFIKNQGWAMYGIVGIDELKKALKRHKVVFDEWVSHHYQADMDYLERMEADRFDPTRKLPDVKSVIVLGAIYSNCGAIVAPLRVAQLWRNCGFDKRTQQQCHNSATTAPQQRHDRGAVARYARGRDYHNVLKKRLVLLADFLRTQNPKLETQTYLSVDSGPTVDRVLAEAAGLGFFGKNCNIINPKIGSFFFIASVMTNLELKPTEKTRMPNCGNCTKCLDNCPTGALISPGVLDARKCISYLTIENKGGIPVELRAKIGNHLFGCDECQNCCPFNERKQKVLIDEFSPNAGAGESLDLKMVLSIKTDEEFAEKFAGTPLMRAKRKGLIRNARIVAKNVKG